MFKKYDIKNLIPESQQKYVSELINEVSNIQLLKSEEGIRSVISSYSDKFKTLNNKLMDLLKYNVTYKDKIKQSSFDDLFKTLWIDLKSLYNQLEYVDSIIALNLGRNKKFFTTLKKHTKDLFNKIQANSITNGIRSNYDIMYLESFSDSGEQHIYNNLIVNKKTGVMTLDPVIVNINNKSYMINNIQTYTYPSHNNEGGVIKTTNKLNTFEYNYNKSTKDMLINGLWKEQFITKDIPDITYNIGDDNNKVIKNFNGILSIIDIEFTNPIEINSFNFDLFGEFPTIIVGLFYKDSSGNIIPFRKTSNTLNNDLSSYDKFKPITAFDVVNILNLDIIKSDFIRIVLNQENYEILNSSELSISSLEEKINKDMSEKRYDVINLNDNIEYDLLTKNENESESLYSELMNIIEMTSSIEDTLNKIYNILDPKIELTTVDFSKTLKYEIGAWSIEPILYKYSGDGVFLSSNYTLNDKSMILASLNVKQDTPNESMCNWYISNDNYNYNIPIIHDNSRYRKEKPYLVVDNFYINNGWTGCFINLDFPIDMKYLSDILIYRNSVVNKLIDYDYFIFSSTLIYIHDISVYSNDNIVVQYYPAKYESISIYSLVNIKKDVIDLSKNVVAPRRSILRYFLYKYSKTEYYDVVITRCLKEEYNTFFKHGNIYMSNEFRSYLNNIGEDIDVIYPNTLISRGNINRTFFTDGFIERNIIIGDNYASAPPKFINRS